MWIFYTPVIENDMELPADEAAHCVRVLRLQVGDGVCLTDGKGCFYDARITAVTGKRCLVHIEDCHEQQPLWSGHLHIAMAPTKLMDRCEWMVEKAVEIGVDEISFLLTEHTERTVIKTDRIGKIAVSAMKQSKKARLPKINGMVPFRDFISACGEKDRFIAHCEYGDEGKHHLMTLLHKGVDSVVMIGPEGDFSPSEIREALEAGFRPVSLGPSRLRTETAAVAAVHIMNLVNQDMTL